MRKFVSVRRILRGATPIDYGLSVAVAVIVAISVWGSAGNGTDRPAAVNTAVHA